MILDAATDNCTCAICDEVIAAGWLVYRHEHNPDGVVCAGCASALWWLVQSVREEERAGVCQPAYG